MAARQQVLSAYKNLLRAASKWEHYGFREYTKIRARDAFRQNIGLTDKDTISKCIKEAQDGVELIKRQSVVGNLFTSSKLVVEK